MTDRPTDEPTEHAAEPADDETSGRRTWWLAAGAALIVVAVVAAALMLGGDDDDEGGGEAASSADAFWGHRWQLTSSSNGDEGTLYTDSVIVLDTTVEGTISFNGCNGGSTSATLEGDQLDADEFAMTQMACVDEDGELLMAVDTLFSTLLPADPTVTVDGDTMTLTSGELSATFSSLGGDTGATTGDSSTVPGDPDDPVDSDGSTVPGQGSAVPPDGGGSAGSPGADAFWGQRWELTAIDAGTVTGVTALADGTAPSIDARTEGSVSYTGCNGGRGSASLEGADLVVGPMMSTKMACGGADGEALMAQDAAIAAILEGRPTVTFEGDTLVLTSDAGTIEATPAG